MTEPMRSRLPLYALRPPYERLSRLAIGNTDLLRSAAAPIVAVAVGPGEPARQLEESVIRARRAFAFAPVIIRQSGSEQNVHLARAAGLVYARAYLLEDEPVAATLRDVITRPADLGADVAEWLWLRLPRLDPRTAELVAHVIRAAPDHATMESLLRAVAEHERTARARLAKARLPGVGFWLRVGHALPALFEAQRHQESPLLRIALDHGFHDQAALSNQVLRLFGSRPGMVRRTLGWEWWLDQALSRRDTRWK